MITRALLLLSLLAGVAVAGPDRRWHRLAPEAGAPDSLVGFGVEALGDDAEPALLVCRCSGGQLDVFVIVDTSMVGEDALSQRVHVFVDELPATFEDWIASTEVGSLFARDAYGIAERLRKAHHLELGIRGPRGRTATLQFDVRGFEQPFAMLSAECPRRAQRVLPQFGEYVHIDELPVAMRKVSPDYPPEAKASEMEGTVVVQALVDVDGTVADTKVVKSVPELDAAAVAAVLQWTFKPALSNGKPVASWVAVPVKFSLR